ncbi:hypothetical protein M0802_004177 [Mischocyttarus mexicanus]|nr:hypothetical protein M0802_004177 [Mischocyttarus mexicanus]
MSLVDLVYVLMQEKLTSWVSLDYNGSNEMLRGNGNLPRGWRTDVKRIQSSVATLTVTASWHAFAATLGTEHVRDRDDTAKGGFPGTRVKYQESRVLKLRYKILRLQILHISLLLLYLSVALPVKRFQEREIEDEEEEEEEDEEEKDQDEGTSHWTCPCIIGLTFETSSNLTVARSRRLGVVKVKKMAFVPCQRASIHGG